MVSLDEETIDDILYFARANEASELSTLLTDLATTTKASQADILAAVIDSNSKNSPLHYAAGNGHDEIVKILLSTPSPILNATNESGNTALHWASLNGHLPSVKLLVEAGADVTIINSAGHDAVFEAEINDKNDVVDWLLGAVEALEKGVGGAGDGEIRLSAGNVEESGNVDVNGDDREKDTEEVRKGVEGMNTGSGDPKDG
ncbi:ankyrin, partial [Dothidotthia symphoricarpi CBS 119687]